MQDSESSGKVECSDSVDEFPKPFEAVDGMTLNIDINLE